jgi:hypothetical protein
VGSVNKDSRVQNPESRIQIGSRRKTTRMCVMIDY